MDLRSATERGRDKLIDADVYKDFAIVHGEEAGSGGGAVWDSVLTRRINDLLWGIGLELQAGGSDGHGEPAAEHGPRRRYFVSLIDESVYKKGVFQRLRRRHKVRGRGAGEGPGWGTRRPRRGRQSAGGSRV